MFLKIAYAIAYAMTYAIFWNNIKQMRLGLGFKNFLEKQFFPLTKFSIKIRPMQYDTSQFCTGRKCSARCVKQFNYNIEIDKIYKNRKSSKIKIWRELKK